MFYYRYWYRSRALVLLFIIVLIFGLTTFFIYNYDDKNTFDTKTGFNQHDIDAALFRHENLLETYKLTGIILHWQRLNGVRQLVHTMLDNNNLFSQIIIWNNNPNENLKYSDLLIKNETNLKRIRIINSKENIKDQAKYRACEQAHTEACFYADDDWDIRLYMHSLYAHFLLEPTILHAITDQFTYFTNLMWSFFDLNINLHTGFSWIGCGSIFLREHAIRHLKYIEYFLNNDVYRELIPQSDQFFSIWMNQLPAQFNGHLSHSEEGSFSSFQNTNFQTLQYQASILNIEILEKFLRNSSNTDTFERRRASNHLVTYTKSPCTYNSSLIFYTNCLPIDKLEDIPFDIKKDYERGTRKNLPHINKSKYKEHLHYFEKYSTVYAVDNNKTTCWKMSRTIRRNDLFGIDFEKIYLDGTLTFLIQFSHEKSLQKQLEISISLDSETWITLPPDHQSGIIYKNQSQQVKFITRLFPLGYQSFRFISFISLIDDDRSLKVCEVRIID